MTMIIHKQKVELKKKRNGDMGRVSTCQKNCKTIDLCGAQVNNAAVYVIYTTMYSGKWY